MPASENEIATGSHRGGKQIRANVRGIANDTRRMWDRAYARNQSCDVDAGRGQIDDQYFHGKLAASGNRPFIAGDRVNRNVRSLGDGFGA